MPPDMLPVQFPSYRSLVSVQVNENQYFMTKAGWFVCSKTGVANITHEMFHTKKITSVSNYIEGKTYNAQKSCYLHLASYS